MHRVLLRLGVLSAAVIMGGTVMVVTSTTDAVFPALAPEMADDPICLYIDGVWHCFDVFEGSQDSRRPVPSNS